MALIEVNETITIAFSVSDRHKSAAWYGEVLGFETLFHADEAGWSEVASKTAGVTLGFGEHMEPAPGNCVPVFGSDDLDADREKMEAAGIRFDGPTDVAEGMVKTATFFDPDGNALMLAEDLTGQG